MKRAGNLYSQIYDFGNLLKASAESAKGKRFRPDVVKFNYHLEKELFALQDELKSRQYQPGTYHSFYITDPKKRLISAAPYRDRLVHHALCQVVEPIFEKSFIFSSYANRKAKGSHKALDRCTDYCRRYKYVLKCDIEKYFPSVDHEILFGLIERKIKCPETLWLIRAIINNSNEQEERICYFPGDNLFTPIERRHGIPIGNLTSQYFANIYLNGFDHYVKEELKCKAYIRYVDDFLVFSDDKAFLNLLRPALQKFLNNLRLRMHPNKCQISAVKNGVSFLGWQVFPGHRRLKRATGLRIQKKSNSLFLAFLHNQINEKSVKSSVASWKGHLKHGSTKGLQGRLFSKFSPFINTKSKSL
jgi:retron-type reverse transcriptase